ncbi:MAG: AI-2E family transporter, partial [Bacteroides sp.]
MLEKKITFDGFIRSVLWIAGLIGILYLFERLSGVLLPFFIAWLIAYMIYPLVKFFQYKLRFKSRVISIFCAIFTVVGIVALAFVLFVPPMVEELGKLKDLLTVYVVNGAQTAAIPSEVSDFIQKNIDVHRLNNMLTEENIANTLKETLPQVWTFFLESINILFSILASFVILLYLIFILLDYESIAEGWIHLLPIKYRQFTAGLVKDLQIGMNKYFRGQALVAFCVGILFSIGFLIIDFPLAIGLGLFIGALNMVPYLQLIGFIP